MQHVIRSTVIDAPIEQVWSVLRDFNSHLHWHPAIAASEIEGGGSPSRVGCVRAFRLEDGHELREQLLSLDDAEHRMTYCILDATLPMRRYAATVTLKPVTDGRRTFWHWESRFDTPAGRGREFAERVGEGVYVRGFEGLRRYLRTAGVASARAGPGGTGAAAAADGALRTHAMLLEAYGDADAMRWSEIDVLPPGPGEVRVRHTAIGVNFIDVYLRRGSIPAMLPLPGIPGMEAAGIVIDTGEGVGHVLPGDRVGILSAEPGCYAGARTIAADRVVRLPAQVSDEQAAALLLKGISAQAVLHDVAHLQAGERVLVHAAAGALGLLLVQSAKSIGAHVIGTVSTGEKAALARANGCDEVVVTADYRFADAVMRMTGGHGVDVLIDGLGEAARDDNLRALALRGRWVSIGQASGPLSPVDPERLVARSALLARPVVFAFVADAASLQRRAAAVFDAFARGVLQPLIGARYPLAAAARAHADLEARRSSGALVLLP